MIKIAVVDFQGLDSEATHIKLLERIKIYLDMNDEIIVYFQIIPSYILVPLFQQHCYQFFLTVKETYRKSKKIWLVGVIGKFEKDIKGIITSNVHSYKYDEIIELPSTSKNLRYYTEVDAIILNWMLLNANIIFACHYRHITLSKCDRILSKHKDQIYNLTSLEIEEQIKNLLEDLPPRERQISKYYNLGWSYEKIGQIYSLSASRIRQLLLYSRSNIYKKLKKERGSDLLVLRNLRSAE